MLPLILSFLIINASPDVGTAGFTFLKFTPSAKEAAMANTSIGLESNGGFGFWYNPSSIVKGSAISLGYLGLPAGIQYGAVGYAKSKPISFVQSGGIGVTFLNSGPMKRTDEAGNELGTFSVTYACLKASGNIIQDKNINAGVGIKILYGSIDSFMGFGLAGDLGIRYKPTIQGLTLGVAVKNFGYQVKAFDQEKDKLPLDIGIGAGYNASNDITLAFDVHKPIDNRVLFNLGVEGWANKYVALRAGYNSLGEDYKTGGSSDIMSGFSVGLGVKYLNYQVDYSFTPMGDWGRLHHITLFLSL